MEINLVGIGCGLGTLTTEGIVAVRSASVVIGAKRLLDEMGNLCRPDTEMYAAISAEDICKRIRKAAEDEKGGNEKPDGSVVTVLFSGDCGFYSGAAGLSELLKAEGLNYRVIPGISSVQLMSARISRPWQDWHLVSGHGRKIDVIAEMMHGKDTLFLTDSATSPAAICKALCAAGLHETAVCVGERLGLPDERILSGTAEETAGGEHAALSVLFVEKIPVPKTYAGILDEEMIRGKVPMTKQEVRAAAVSHLQPLPSDTVWDVGAGTGSVSAALAQAARYGRVYAVEHKEEACALIEENRRAQAVWNLQVVKGRAPEALEDLPAPDAVFIGGSEGQLENIIDLVLRKNKDARICISALLVETLGTAAAAFTARGIPFTVTEAAISQSSEIAGKHMMKAQNPIWLIDRR